MLQKGVANFPVANVAARPERAKVAGDGTVYRGEGGIAKRSVPKRPETDCRPRRQRLTTRQVEILMALKDGASNKEIARNLGILESTVKVHLKSIYRQLCVRNRTQAAIVSAQYETARS
jgi:DNA-binding NarL/FixJ family response regulator